jgi:hypothetical protein
VAVSKLKPPEMIREAIAAGQLDFGENYAQELRDKMAAVTEPARWHFIGRLQRNKVKYVAGKVFELHSLDGLELARELSRKCGERGSRMRVFLEVNLGAEAAKSGIEPAEAPGLVKAMREIVNLELVGLMTMPPYFQDPESARPFYRGLRELRDRLREELSDPGALPELSMGLSNDFEVAIEEGATRARIGTAIFGEREKP